MSSFFPAVASILEPDDLPRWAGSIDDVLAAAFAVASLLVFSRRPSEFTIAVWKATLRTYRAVANVFLVLLALFFALGDRIRWDILLPDLAWRHADDDDAFLRGRALYLSESGYGTYEEVLSALRTWEAALKSYPSYDEVVLWFEHDLFDPLILIRLLDWFGRRELGRTRVSLVCIGE
jgi:hypothetical protein